jgi:ATP-dependent Lon protease
MASMAMFGNTNQPVEMMVRSSHLLLPMPDVIREDMAFLDRVHYYRDPLTAAMKALGMN